MKLKGKKKDLISCLGYRFMVCLLGIIFIFSSLGAVYAVDEDNNYLTILATGYDSNYEDVSQSLILYYIWLTLNAWGINVTVDEVEEYNAGVESALREMIADYLSTVPSIGGWAKWIFPWTFTWDVWGNLQGNSNFLEDIQSFAQYLIAKHNLQNNGTIWIDPQEYITLSNGTKVYALIGSWAINGWWPKNTSTEGAFIFNKNIEYKFSNNIYLMCSDEVLWSGYTIVAFSGGTPITQDNVKYATGTISGQDGGHYYTGEFDGVVFIKNILPNPDMYTFAPEFQGVLVPTGGSFRDQYGGYLYKQYSGVSIGTADIILPNDDEDYTDGDSITIIDGEPVYMVIEFPEEIKVSNLPAIISTGTIPVPGDELNPGLVNAWHPISTLIEMTADSMGMMIGIVYEFPEEVLIPIFAVLGGIIIFGVIHAMKEH